ncbi:MAG: hypothetical protein JSV09_09895 [Thermoplasmata archaeon]|nr:MAG: hypothetical protein JSV09_09895 [Thermoplasmata archaeon]
MTIVTIQSSIPAKADDVRLFIHGPEKLQVNTSAEYIIEITGGPAEEGGNWSFAARIADKDNMPVPSASVVPDNMTSPQNSFKVNVTSPNEAQTIVLIANGTSFINLTNLSRSGDYSKEIEVFEPIIVNISATIRNPSLSDVKEAIISFYIRPKDGSFTKLGNKTVDVGANSTQDVHIEWVASKTDYGEYEVEVRIDEEGTLLEFNDGDNVMRETIYIGDRPERTQSPIMIFNSGLVFILDVIAFFFFIGALWMRRKTVRGRGYYSTTATNTMYFEGLVMILLSIPVFSVSQIISANPDDVSGDPTGRMIEAIWIFVLGFLTILLTWDRTRKKRR